MITSYCNTNKKKGKELVKSEEKAMTQEEAIKNIFFTKKWIHEETGILTPSEVCLIYNIDYKDNTPITSIRRAINTLTNKGKLIKTDKMKEGSYGKPEHCWRLAKEADKQLELL